MQKYGYFLPYLDILLILPFYLKLVICVFVQFIFHMRMETIYFQENTNFIQRHLKLKCANGGYFRRDF